jgi:hypothetical protein
MAIGSDCNGQHRFFVAATFQVEAEGKIGALVICTNCPESYVALHKVAEARSVISLDDKK